MIQCYSSDSELHQPQKEGLHLLVVDKVECHHDGPSFAEESGQTGRVYVPEKMSRQEDNEEK